MKDADYKNSWLTVALVILVFFVDRSTAKDVATLSQWEADPKCATIPIRIICLAFY